MSETSKKVIEEIKDKKIKPISRRYFVIKNIAVWASLLASVVFGAISISVEEVLVERASNPYAAANIGISHGIINWISFLWMFSTILFIALAYMNVRSTKDGYRYRAAWVVIGILLVLTTLGVLFRVGGVGERVDSIFESHCDSAAPCPANLPPR